MPIDNDFRNELQRIREDVAQRQQRSERTEQLIERTEQLHAQAAAFMLRAREFDKEPSRASMIWSSIVGIFQSSPNTQTNPANQTSTFFKPSVNPPPQSDIAIKLEEINAEKEGFDTYFENQFPTAQYADLYCPISLKLMRDPVKLGDTGHSFDRAFIEKWLDYRPHINPMTNLKISDVTLSKNVELEKAILNNIDIAAYNFLNIGCNIL